MSIYSHCAEEIARFDALLGEASDLVPLVDPTSSMVQPSLGSTYESRLNLL